MPVVESPLSPAASALAASSLPAAEPPARAVLADSFERVHEVLRAQDEVEGMLCIKSRQGVVVAVALVDLPRAVDRFNGLVSQAMSHYSGGMRSFANNTVRAAGVLMADSVGQVGSSASQLMSDSVKTAWGWGTWPARKTLALLMAPLYGFADPAALPSLEAFEASARRSHS